jgi:hypothetical protein
VPKSDPTVQTMLAVRQDIFDGYTEDAFASALSGQASIVACREISSTGRKLFTYQR